MTTTPNNPADTVARTLENYAQRGVFRGFGRAPGTRNGQTTFNIVWHRDQHFHLTLDPRRSTLRFGILLPDIPDDSDIYTLFKNFLREKQRDDLPEHRRIHPDKLTLRAYKRARNVALSVKIHDADYDYATRKLIHFIHEVFLDFLTHGPQYEYFIQTFDLDPDDV